MLGSRSNSTYPSGVGGRSGSRQARHSTQRPLPLGSWEGRHRKDLRPDNLALVVTNIESQDVENSWLGSSSGNSSEERLALDHNAHQGKIEVGIHQTIEVTQTTDGEDGEGSHRSAREHV